MGFSMLDVTNNNACAVTNNSIIALSQLWQPYFVLLNLHLKGLCGTHSLHVMCIQSLKDIQYEILSIVYFGMKMNVCM